jgi:dTDP-4-dehydrorhamnose reductase
LNIKNKKILITGSSGQLANAFIDYFKSNNISFSAPSEKDLDIISIEKIKAVMDKEKPDILINCAAYNQVDKAEEEAQTAYKVNSSAVDSLSKVCKEKDIFFIHYSSDYVFDGQKYDLYNEKDTPNPLNVYGKSKLEGENNAINNSFNFLLFRLSWVFGKGKQNFLYKLYNWAKSKQVLKISADETSVPTYTEDVVKITIKSLEKDVTGLYHLPNSGYCSRCELARYFLKKLNLNNIIVPVSKDEFKTKAERPLFSAMSNKNVSKKLAINIPSWENAVERFILRYFKSNNKYE